jgi:hypothetical protein
VGLIQRLVESSGIPTISLGNMPERMKLVRPPRALYVRFPRGSMFGEPFNSRRQRRILLDALQALCTMKVPGTVHELPYRWKNPD